MNNTNISWTNKTWNPVTGCTKYSAGCANCYAETMTRRFKKAFPNGFNVTLHPERLNEPKKVTDPTMFFVCSMADLFHEDVPFEYIDRVMQTIKDCPQHTFQILTKRAGRLFDYYTDGSESIPLNCWCGVTVETRFATQRIEFLRDMRGVSVRFLSCEPLIEDLGVLNLDRIDWVIVGGETGPKARLMKKEWVLNIKSQCDKQGVPFFFKSWGRYIYMENINLGPKDQQVLLEGLKYQAYPRGWEKGETK